MTTLYTFNRSLATLDDFDGKGKELGLERVVSASLTLR